MSIWIWIIGAIVVIICLFASIALADKVHKDRNKGLQNEVDKLKADVAYLENEIEEIKQYIKRYMRNS